MSDVGHSKKFGIDLARSSRYRDVVGQSPMEADMISTTTLLLLVLLVVVVLLFLGGRPRTLSVSPLDMLWLILIIVVVLLLIGALR